MDKKKGIDKPFIHHKKKGIEKPFIHHKKKGIEKPSSFKSIETNCETYVIKGLFFICKTLIFYSVTIYATTANWSATVPLSYTYSPSTS